MSRLELLLLEELIKVEVLKTLMTESSAADEASRIVEPKRPEGLPMNQLGLKPSGGVHNILAVYNQATPEEKEYWGKWYHNAKVDVQDLAFQYNLPMPVVAAIVAVLSPGNKWNGNLLAAEKLLRGDTTKINAYPRQVSRALAILKTGDTSLVTGPKVSVFFKSLMDPTTVERDMVLDGHAINIWRGEKAALKALRNPTTRERAQMIQDYQAASEELKVSVQAIQATTWYIWKYTGNSPALSIKKGKYDVSHFTGGNQHHPANDNSLPQLTEEEETTASNTKEKTGSWFDDKPTERPPQLQQTWSMEKFQKLKTINQMLGYAKRTLGPPIGKGSARTVFRLPGGDTVLKIASDRGIGISDGEAGSAQNEGEATASDFSQGNMFAQVLQKSPDGNYSWIVSEYAKPLTNERDFERITKIEWYHFLNITSEWDQIRRFNSLPYSRRDLPDAQRDIDYLRTKSKWFDTFLRFLEVGDINPGDFKEIKHWGMVSKPRPHLVVLDYGFTEKVRTSFYR